MIAINVGVTHRIHPSIHQASPSIPVSFLPPLPPPPQKNHSNLLQSISSVQSNPTHLIPHRKTHPQHQEKKHPIAHRPKPTPTPSVSVYPASNSSTQPHRHHHHPSKRAASPRPESPRVSSSAVPPSAPPHRRSGPQRCRPQIVVAVDLFLHMAVVFHRIVTIAHPEEAVGATDRFRARIDRAAEDAVRVAA